MTYTNAAIRRVVEIAVGAAQAHQAGATVWTPSGAQYPQALRLREGGLCARFIRQVHETACGFKPGAWLYAGANARAMTDALERAGKSRWRGDDLMPGDIIGIHRNSGAHGHIGIYVGAVGGVSTLAENTSSATRGNPRRAGTKLTPFADIAHRVTGTYRLLAEAWQVPEAEGAPAAIPVYVDGERIGDGVLIGEQTMVHSRSLGDALGCKVMWDAKAREVRITTPGKEARL